MFYTQSKICVLHTQSKRNAGNLPQKGISSLLSYSPTIKATADGSGCSHPHRESFKDFILQQGIPWGNSVPCAAAFLHINIFCNVFQSLWISPHSPQMAAQLGIPDFLPQVFVFSVLLPHPPCLPPSWNKEFRAASFPQEPFQR